jgi:hypothetical protein
MLFTSHNTPYITLGTVMNNAQNSYWEFATLKRGAISLYRISGTGYVRYRIAVRHFLS